MPYSFCSVLRAECTVLPKENKILLSMVVKRLLQSINKEDIKDEGESVTKGYSEKVHILNVLRQLIKDKVVNEYLRPYMEEITMVTLENYKSSSFVVRNSATLVFATLIDRLLKLRNMRPTEESRARDKSSSSFFGKYPRVFKYFSSGLNESIEICKKETAPNYLFPILLILSQLNPPKNTKIVQEKQQHQILIEPLLEILCSSDKRIREMSSKAIVALVPSNEAPLFFNQISEKILSSKINCNHLDGLLLVLKQFLVLSKSGFNSISSDFETIQSTFIKMNQIIESKKCPPISYLYFNILRNSGENKEWTEWLEKKSVDFLFSNQVGFLDELVSQEHSDFLSRYLFFENNSHPNFEDIVSRIIQNERYEVRVSLFKVIREISKKTRKNIERKLFLQDLLIKTLKKETFYESVALIMSILKKIEVTFAKKEEIEQFINLISQIKSKQSNFAVNKQYIGLMGFCFGNLLGKQLENTETKKIMEGFVSTLEQFSHSSEPIENRFSSLSSVFCFFRQVDVKNFCLQNFQDDPKLSQIVVRIWMVLNRFLQDDDLDIRRNCSSFFCNQIVSKNEMDENKALEISFEYLSSIFPLSCFEVFFGYLSKVPSYSKFNVLEFTKACERAVFDLEPDNYFKEIPLKTQIISYQLTTNIIPFYIKNNLSKTLCNQFSVVCSNLEKFSSWLSETMEKIGDVWCQILFEDSFVFASLYKVLMSLSVFLGFPLDVEKEEIDKALSNSFKVLEKYSNFLHPFHLKAINNIKTLETTNSFVETYKVLQSFEKEDPFKQLSLYFLTNYEN